MSVNFLIALAGALGVGLVAAGILYPVHRAVKERQAEDKSGLAGAERLAGSAMAEEEITVFEKAPLLDRLVGPALRDLTGVLSRDPHKRQELKSRLRRSGWRYKSAGDFYANKIMTAALFFVGGAVAVVLMGEPALFFIPLLLGVLGLYIPDYELSQALKKRRKAVYVEMAFTLDQLALMLKAGVALGQALQDYVKAEGGGIFTAALRGAVTRISLGAKEADSLELMLADLPEEPELEKFVQRVRKKGSLADALRAQADLMRNRVESDLLAQGLRSTLVITTIGGAFILPSLALLVVGPPIVLALRIFQF